MKNLLKKCIIFEEKKAENQRIGTKISTDPLLLGKLKTEMK